jgi:hypothetical protein
MTTPIDQAERVRRELVSAVKRLRVLATSDPAKGEELADTLVRLTGVRLLSLDLAEAASDAPEAVLLAARLLARNGAAGPYTSPADAARFFTASALLAAVQSGLGQLEAAARTLAGVDGWIQQLGRFPLRDHLEPRAVIWSLVARARTLLATEVPTANACADAAARRLYAAGLDAAQDYLPLTVHLLLADTRWAAGLPTESLAHHGRALAAYRSLFGPAAGRLRPAVAQVAIAPLAALHEPYAQRLAHLGDTLFAVAVRRAEVARLEELGAPAPVLAAARTGLARALAAEGRGEESAAELAEAVALDPAAAAHPEAKAAQPGEPCSWTESAWTGLGAVPEDDAALAAAAARLSQELQVAVFDGVAGRLEAQQSEERIRAEAEADATERAAEREEAERAAQAEEAAALAAAQERDRLRAEEAASRRQAEEAAARAAADERRRQLAEEHQRRLAVDPAAADAAAAELAAARARVQDGAGDLREQHDAQERLAALLRPLALLDPDRHRAELATALEALVGLRWRLGDPDGSREAAREARTLAADAGH